MLKRLLVVALVACSCVQVGESQGAADIRFGVIVDGKFLETRRVPNLVGHSYGWVAAVDPARPTKWTERFTLPVAPASWGPGESDPNVEISPDRKTATMSGINPPGSGQALHFWAIAEGDPNGNYRMVVTLSDGRAAEFDFEITPVSTPAEAGRAGLAR